MLEKITTVDDFKKSWNIIKFQLQNLISIQEYIRWFEPLKIVNFCNNEATILIPNMFVQFFIEENYLKTLKKLFLENFNTNINIRFVMKNEISNKTDLSHNNIEEENKIKKIKVLNKEYTKKDLDRINARYTRPEYVENLKDDNTLFNFEESETAEEFNNIAKDLENLIDEKVENTQKPDLNLEKLDNKKPLFDDNKFNSNFVRSTTSNSKDVSWQRQVSARRGQGTVMNPRYKFENFVVGLDCQFSHSVAKAVAKSPGQAYNPLFFFASPGLGKSHLLQSIGYEIIEKRQEKVVYTTGEQFTNEFIDSIQRGNFVKFRKKYRQVDVLLIDDIHFLAGKEKSMEEFFHTFNTLMDRRKQIVLTSDRAPSDISSLENRLVSRFEWGLTSEIPRPDYETRVAILRKKMELWKITLPYPIVDYLANKIDGNIRRLEGSLMKVATYSSLCGHQITKDKIDHLLKDLIVKKNRTNIEEIKKLVCSEFPITMSELSGKGRTAKVNLPRQIGMYLCRKNTQNSLKEIAISFGKKDHTSVIHACKALEVKFTKDSKIKLLVDKMMIKL